jgi:hypothetical protein
MGAVGAFTEEGVVVAVISGRSRRLRSVFNML